MPWTPRLSTASVVQRWICYGNHSPTGVAMNVTAVGIDLAKVVLRARPRPYDPRAPAEGSKGTSVRSGCIATRWDHDCGQ